MEVTTSFQPTLGPHPFRMDAAGALLCIIILIAAHVRRRRLAAALSVAGLLVDHEKVVHDKSWWLNAVPMVRCWRAEECAACAGFAAIPSMMMRNTRVVSLAHRHDRTRHARVLLVCDVRATCVHAAP